MPKEVGTGVVSIEWNKKVYIQCDKDANITMFSNPRAAKRAWEGAYDTAFIISEGTRETACLHAVLFDICVHQVHDVEWFRGKIIETPFDVQCFSELGGIYGIECTGPTADIWHFSGVSISICKREHTSTEEEPCPPSPLQSQ